MHVKPDDNSILWLEHEDSGYVSDASRALDAYVPEKHYMMLSGMNPGNLAITLHGTPVAELTLDENQVITNVDVWFSPNGKTNEEMVGLLKPFIGRRVLYRAKQ